MASINRSSITLASWLLALGTLAAGLYTKEIVLTLMALISLFILSYSFASLLLVYTLYKKQTGTLSCTITPEDAPEGTAIRFELTNLEPNSVFRFSLPGIVSRYELELKTADEKMLTPSIPLQQKGITPIQTLQTTPDSRGVYFGATDRLALYDLFGFYILFIPVGQNQAERLILRPKPAEKGIPLQFQKGGSTRREDQHYQRTEELTEHRPYIPGDDPRRINWKLFGHSGDLFIRQGEQEPPPVAEFVLVLDTSVDYTIFSPEEGRRLVDALCRETLSLALELARHHYAITLCFPGSGILQPDETSVSKALAYPVAVDIAKTPPFPEFPRASSLLILALPRQGPSETALNILLRRAVQSRFLRFINPAEVLGKASYQELYESCVHYYGQVHGT